MESQLRLFGTDEDFGAVAQCLLGIPGLAYYSGFLNSTEQLRILNQIDALPWQDDLKRRVQHYGYKYDYRARRVDHSMFVGELPDFLVQVGNKLVLNGILYELPDQVIVNEYLPGQGITPHVDCEPCFKDTIVTISLGSVYAMEFYSTRTDDVFSFDLELGSALVLSGDARFHWKHGIKARKNDNDRRRGRRVSLTYRNVIVQQRGE